MIRPDRGCRAFVFTPFVATATWYVSTLARLAVENGRLTEGQAVTFGLGALMFGLPAAGLVTLFVAAPLYRVLDDSGRLTAGAALAGGGLIGVAVSLVFALVERTWSSWMMPLWQGAAVGVVSAACWWGWRGLLSRFDVR